MGRMQVETIAVFNFDKTVRPIKIQTSDGVKIKIDRVIDISNGASLKAGVNGIRYICDASVLCDDDVLKRTVYLYRNENEWYLETDDSMQNN